MYSQTPNNAAVTALTSADTPKTPQPRSTAAVLAPDKGAMLEVRMHCAMPMPLMGFGRLPGQRSYVCQGCDDELSSWCQRHDMNRPVAASARRDEQLCRCSQVSDSSRETGERDFVQQRPR
jgi:hypothetical protein